jgi:hypothetical protein
MGPCTLYYCWIEELGGGKVFSIFKKTKSSSNKGAGSVAEQNEQLMSTSRVDDLDDKIASFRKMLAELQYFVFCLNSIPTLFPPEFSLSEINSEEADDDMLISRIITEYQKSRLNSQEKDDSEWDKWTSTIKGDIHRALLDGNLETVKQMLRHPEKNRFFWGFDAICLSTHDMPEPHELVLKRLNDSVDWRELYARWVYDSLVSLCSITGVIRWRYPEIDINARVDEFIEPRNIDELLDGLERQFEIPLSFPNVFTHELGLKSNRGIISMRAVQSLYQAYRICELVEGNRNARILEIGAGLGRTAYYCWEMGFHNYTIIDIPLTNTAQAYYLGRTLGDNRIVLEHEVAPASEAMRILSPDALDNLACDYDLVVNIDSLTEMDIQSRERYWSFIQARAKCFFSVNHEENAHMVRELFPAHLNRERKIYPVRRGYMEEIVKIQS